MGAEQAAWVTPTTDAVQAAAGVLQAANGFGGFNLPPALASVVSAIAPQRTPGNKGGTTSASVPPPPPPARPGMLSRLIAWAKDKPVLAGAVALAIIGGAFLLLRRRG